MYLEEPRQRENEPYPCWYILIESLYQVEKSSLCSSCSEKKSDIITVWISTKDVCLPT